MIDLFANIFGYLLKVLNDACGNFGIAIILFTIITKAIMLPLIIKQQKATKQMAKVQPKLQEIQDKYKDDKEQYAIEITKLQKEEKFNPFTGCIIALIQIPIILGMFYIVSKPLTYMEKMTPDQIQVYAEKLEGNEEIKNNNRYYQEIEIIKQNPELNINMEIFGINLGDIPNQHKENKYLLIIPFLSVVVTLMSVLINTKITDEMNKENPQYAQTQSTMKVMNYVLPVMSGYIAYQVPLGLGAYWLISNLIQTIEYSVLRRYFKKGDVENNG